MSIYKSAALAAFAALLLTARVAHADERIENFDSTITVRPDGTLEVHEVIRVNAEHRNINRGIYRDFPTIYSMPDGRRVSVGFQFQSATRDGAPEDWHLQGMGNGVRIYLGNAKRTVSVGEHTYEISYLTDRELGFFADHDELYWNVTGVGWGFPIERATARIILPEAIPRDQIRMEGYTGPQGAKGQAYSATLDDGAPYYSTTQPLAPYEGLTIVAMWPKGFITPQAQGLPQNVGGQSAASGYVNAFADYAPIEKMLRHKITHTSLPFFIALIGFAGLMYRYYRAWDRVGRDPPGRVIIPEYEPPQGLSPAAMRYLIEWGKDNTGFTAAVLSLAVKGHLRIDQSKGILGFGKTYTLSKTSRADAKPASPDESALLAGLFRDSDEVALVQSNHSVVRHAISTHGTSLDRAYSEGYFAINGGEVGKGVLLTILLIAATVIWPGSADSYPDWYFGDPLGWLTEALLVAAVVSNIVWGKLLRAPTVRGAETTAHILGFKQYLEVAEGEDLKRVKDPPPPLTPQLYEAYLPAALALGVEQKWAERFVGVFDVNDPHYSPAWYTGTQFSAANLAGFTAGLGSSLNSAISSSSTPPGSSSGGGGGGSSGGGGGGGGGGGW